MSRAHNNRLALILFAVYLLLYCGFLLINVFQPDLMETTPFAGVNLAIWYGFGLILAAVVLAFFYGMMCKSDKPSDSHSSSHEQTGGRA